jgi:hypothetical protein
MTKKERARKLEDRAFAMTAKFSDVVSAIPTEQIAYVANLFTIAAALRERAVEEVF